MPTHTAAERRKNTTVSSGSQEVGDDKSGGKSVAGRARKGAKGPGAKKALPEQAKRKGKGSRGIKPVSDPGVPDDFASQSSPIAKKGKARELSKAPDKAVAPVRKNGIKKPKRGR